MMKSFRRFVRFAVFSCLASAWLTATTFSQINTIPDTQSQMNLGGQNQIVGTVFGSSGRPVERPVQVRLFTLTRGTRTIMTNSTGNFAFRGLATGTYTVSIENEKEFEVFSQTIDLRQFRGGQAQIYTMDIRLVPRPSEGKATVIRAEFADIPAKAQAYYFEAVEKANKGDRPGAIEQLKLAIKEYPGFMYAYNEMGVQYLRLNQPQNADEAFQGALRVQPDAYSPLVNRGIANFMMKRYGEAVPFLRKALAKEDQSVAGHYFLGQAFANLGLFTDAEKELLHSITLGKDQVREAYRILAVIYTQRGDNKKAVDHLERYLQLAPNVSDAEKLRVRLQELKGSI